MIYGIVASDFGSARRVPFLFATGYDAADVPRPWCRVPRVEKPVEVAVIARVLFGGEAP